MKLRLLVTKNCPRYCAGCCNQDWDLDKLPVYNASHNFYENLELIMITGGEPMMFPGLTVSLIRELRERYSCPIVVYTARVGRIDDVKYVLTQANGMTITIHDNNEVMNVEYLQLNHPEIRHKMMYLNMFRNVTAPVRVWPGLWHRVKVVDWISNCPLPQGETFMRLTSLWE